MKRWPAILICLNCLIFSGAAAGPLPSRTSVHSQSGQFIISGTLLTPKPAVFYGVDTKWNRLLPVGRQPGTRRVPMDPVELDGGNKPVLTLDPAYLAASAERVRHAIYERLELPNEHRGKVYITLLRPTNPPQEILIMHLRDSRAGVWNYKMELPAEVRSDHLLRALTHVILLEVANRYGRSQLAELPLWLREGMVEHLRATKMQTLFFSEGKHVSVVGGLSGEISNLKREINEADLLGLEQISWPATLKSGPETERLFRLTSHGLVAELLQLPGGGRYLGDTLEILAQYQNWQFAFLHAFKNYFPTLLDVEKWWAVTSLSLSSGETKQRRLIEENLMFKTLLDSERWRRVTAFYLGHRGANEEWSMEDSYQQLNQILQVPIEWQVGDGDEISREKIGIPDVLTSMDFSLQRPVIERLIARMFGLQLHSPPELARLVRDYRLALEKYLVEREAWSVVDNFSFGRRGSSPMVVTQQAVRKLGELDERRKSLERQSVEIETSGADPVAVSSR